MSGQTSVPNYRETLFAYPDLTPVLGEPTYEALRVLFNQLKANARSIHTTLGGGQFGHLGLVLTAPQYALLSNHPYQEPPQAFIQHMANSAAQQQLMPQMMEQMMQLLQQMSTMQQQMQYTSPSSTMSNASSTSSSRRRRTRTTTSFYCWSHGACAHPSAACNSKRPGHQDTATFNNKMGGSIAFCPSPNTTSGP